MFDVGILWQWPSTAVLSNNTATYATPWLWAMCQEDLNSE